jgi:FolB domain-containing protein
MTIRIDELRFSAIIGLLPHEREREQELIVDLEIDYDYRRGEFLDYARIAEETVVHLREGRYELLEEALLGLEARLRAGHPEIRRLRCRLTKPHILPHARVSVTLERRYS